MQDLCSLTYGSATETLNPSLILAPSGRYRNCVLSWNGTFYKITSAHLNHSYAYGFPLSRDDLDYDHVWRGIQPVGVAPKQLSNVWGTAWYPVSYLALLTSVLPDSRKSASCLTVWGDHCWDPTRRHVQKATDLPLKAPPSERAARWVSTSFIATDVIGGPVFILPLVCAGVCCVYDCRWVMAASLSPYTPSFHI